MDSEHDGDVTASRRVFDEARTDLVRRIYNVADSLGSHLSQTNIGGVDTRSMRGAFRDLCSLAAAHLEGSSQSRFDFLRFADPESLSHILRCLTTVYDEAANLEPNSIRMAAGYEELLEVVTSALTEIKGRDQRRWSTNVRGQLDDYIEMFQQRSELAARARVIEEQEHQIATYERRREVLVENASDVGSRELGAHFRKMADDEGASATLFRGGAIVILAISLIFVLFGGFGLLRDASSVAGAISHLTAFLAGAALSGYLATEASRHRQVSQWAATSAVQLRTVAEFCAPLDDTARDAVMQTLAARVFGQSSTATAPAQATPTQVMTPAMIDQVLAIVKATKS